ncbi:MAG: hypothetical protein IKP86_09130 [Anaerolineaceae bacterium]|nr:hypothetical protein [Anaerolineaceae bacterium]
MRNYLIIFIFIVSAFLAQMAAAESANDSEAEKMAQFDSIIGEIKGLPDSIDEDLCFGNWYSYRSHMTTLAQKIIDANTIIKDVDLAYPIDLWTVYNRISSNPVCGAGKYAAEALGVADVSRISNEERMGIRENDDLCLCWSIVTGREELTGYWKDGACRCTFGINNHNPNIGVIDPD